jgi:hypothetical protein
MISLAHARPRQGARLRVGVDQQHAAAGRGKRRCDVDGDCGFTNAALPIEHADDHCLQCKLRSDQF